MTLITNEELLLIQILKCLLQGETEFPSDLFSQDVNYERLYQIAQRNSVANMAAFLICKSDDVPQEIRGKFDHQRMLITMQQVKCEKALAEACEILQDAKIRGIVLKGTILKNLYPDPFMRSMSDIDVYMEEENILQISPLMVRAGFSTGTIGSGNHYEYLKYDVAKIEYHPELVALDSAYGQQVFLKVNHSGLPVAQAMDIWDHTELFNGNEYVRQLTPEHHYLYVIMHMMNHLLTSGTGIRSIMDVWVMNHHYAMIWDRQDIESLLNEYGLLTIESYALALADKWFDLHEIPYVPKEVNRDLLDSFEQYIIGSGTYGNTIQSLNRQLDYESGTSGKICYLLSRWFLPLDTMKHHYPLLNKHPALLPAFWFYRGIEVFAKRGNSTKHKMKTVMQADREQMEKQKALMDAMIGQE